MNKKLKNDDGYEYFQKMIPEGLKDINNPSKDEIKVMGAAPKKKYTPKQRYRYKGPVYRFDKLIMENADILTIAVSEKQAVNQVMYQIKQQCGYPAYAGGFKLKGQMILEF